jgi:N-acetylglucosaminyldiphosphoundecaprenol N-acetyl-beta-D-mannosaminyltransferase
LLGAGSPWGRLVTSVIVPTLLYAVARVAPISRREWTALLAGLACLGTYLAFTAVMEIAQQWSLIFPHYISDPSLGIHFGRARGPDLNSASLGIYLTACIWCAWTLCGQTSRRGSQLLLLVVLPLMVFGVFLTYTRSTWIGLAASAALVGAIQTPSRWRLPAFSAAGFAGLLVVALAWSHVVGLEREGSAGESEHSVGQRETFTYVSWQIIKDHPIFGVGYGRFFDKKLPYLSDRRQEVELESIRGLHHHNTLLSYLTETGLFGLAAFVALLAAWARSAWQLTKYNESPSWIRAHGLLMLAILVNYFCSAIFHDLALVPAQHSLLFLFAGLTINLRQSSVEQGAWSKEQEKTPSSRLPASGLLVPLFGMSISRLTMRETIDQILGWCREPQLGPCRFIVTPNVDHAVMFQHRADLRAAYSDASLVLADGAPIVLAARLVGRSLPERVAGSDLVPRLFASANKPLRVFLLGAASGVAQQAARQIGQRWSRVEVVGTYSPPIGFENDDAENARIFAMINAAAPDLLVLGLGAPKQELWIHRHHGQLQAKVALCVGATIDFLAGHRRRSPVWMRRVGLEWLHRVCSEPRRLLARYARDAWFFPQLVWRELR